VARPFVAARPRCATEMERSEQSRQPHWPIDLPELPGEAGRCDDIADAADTSSLRPRCRRPVSRQAEIAGVLQAAAGWLQNVINCKFSLDNLS
jgi:hypothetical protein